MKMNEIINNISPAVTFLTAEEIPQLTGTEKQIAWAEKIRTNYGKTYLHVAIKKMSDGRPINAERTQKYVKGTAEEIAKFVLEEATALAAGYDDLLETKIDEEMATQKDMVARYNRYKALVTDKNSAAWWIENRDADFSAYLDGKKIF